MSTIKERLYELNKLQAEAKLPQTFTAMESLIMDSMKAHFAIVIPNDAVKDAVEAWAVKEQLQATLVNYSWGSTLVITWGGLVPLVEEPDVTINSLGEIAVEAEGDAS